MISQRRRLINPDCREEFLEKLPDHYVNVPAAWSFDDHR